MKFKRLLLIALFTGFHFLGLAQDNFNVNLRVGERSVSVDALEIGDELVHFDRRGNIQSDNNNTTVYSYYDRFDADELQGKLKAINGLPVKYYDRFDRDELRGKLKSIGNIKFTYYDVFDRDELRGKLKSVNGIPLKYYDVFDWEELRGKLKSIGDIKITYYDRFDNDAGRGRVKSVKGKTANITISANRSVSSDVDVQPY